MGAIKEFLIVVTILAVLFFAWRIYDDQQTGGQVEKALKYSTSEGRLQKAGKDLRQAEQATKTVLDRNKKTKRLEEENSRTSDPVTHEKNFFQRL